MTPDEKREWAEFLAEVSKQNAPPIPPPQKVPLVQWVILIGGAIVFIVGCVFWFSGRLETSEETRDRTKRMLEPVEKRLDDIVQEMQFQRVRLRDLENEMSGVRERLPARTEQP